MELFFGDLNARHTYWGDKSCNLLGEELVQIADHFSILNDGEPTFLAANGYSVIDLCICYGPLFDRCKHYLSTDEFAELFTGAPQRGHVPVIMRLECSSITEKTKKLWIEKADWVGWTSFVEGHVTRFGKFLRIHNCTRYKQQDVNLFINHLWNLRWKNNDNRSFLKCYTRTPPTCNTISPLFNLQRYEAIKICEMLIGNSFS